MTYQRLFLSRRFQICSAQSQTNHRLASLTEWQSLSFKSGCFGQKYQMLLLFLPESEFVREVIVLLQSQIRCLVLGTEIRGRCQKGVGLLNQKFQATSPGGG